ncbi:aminotransferase class III-fold pyridoxal phosphate-dependent enzyme [Staphylococcus saprophyticus]|uniref:aminotransferase class III-fold pyridoxal phosphate-dependent enzyme n=1 Tax=Staphylococcus saprophyticus TaxID=29385 RepID=UPI000E6A8B43|nr:aminotransferase class III-fold pyridoxal phosphate-dependent enzyme [Staphylococcus saprophyticus]RIO34075.1 aminotransferase class III-fold pyridoxal phosphate-dependent enzyme [Staphylococcus saprophyticus]
MGNSYAMLNGKLTDETLQSIELKRGENSYLYDNNDNQYIDLSSGLWNINVGYNKELNKNIKKSFSDILDNNLPYVDMTSYLHDMYNVTAKTLLDFIDNEIYKKVLFTNSGSESIELALKIVKLLTEENKKILSFSESYHGTYYGGMSISGLNRKLNKSHKVNSEFNINKPIPQNKEEEKEFLEFIKLNSNEINSVFVEPVIGSGGIKYGSLNFYNELLKNCQSNNIIVIFDEVATGFYRTGDKFFFKKLDYSPDIICMSKGLNNGTLPCGTVIINEKIKGKIKHIKSKHMSTQNGNILCQASIFETIKFYNKFNENFIDNVKEIEKITHELCNQFNIEYRNMGAMIALPIETGQVENILKILKKNGILSYRFITETQSGLSLFPHINIDTKLYKRVLKFILKTINKY